MSSRWPRWAVGLAAWIALALLIAIAFHYVKKYEGGMLTDHSQDTVTLPDTPGPTPVVVDGRR